MEGMFQISKKKVFAKKCYLILSKEKNYKVFKGIAAV